MPAPEPAFYERADEHIRLANEQLKNARGAAVAASMTFGAERFNAWMCANLYGTKEEMARMRDDAIRQLTEHYADQLRTNFDTYIADFDNLGRAGVITR